MPDTYPCCKHCKDCTCGGCQRGHLVRCPSGCNDEPKEAEPDA